MCIIVSIERIMLSRGVIDMDFKLAVANEIMKCARDIVGLSMEEVGSLYFENPAKCLRLNDRGKIEVGRKSDLVIMDHDYKVLKTIINGDVYYEAD